MANKTILKCGIAPLKYFPYYIFSLRFLDSLFLIRIYKNRSLDMLEQKTVFKNFVKWPEWSHFLLATNSTSQQLFFCKLCGIFKEFHKSPLIKLHNFWQIKVQPFTKYLRQTLMWNTALREKFNFCFSRDFYYYWQNFYFGWMTEH